jgi:hypothetical protein
MEITVARNAEEIFSLSALRKSTWPRPSLTWTRVPNNIPRQPRKEAKLAQGNLAGGNEAVEEQEGGIFAAGARAVRRGRRALL